MTALECLTEDANDAADIVLANGVQTFHSPPGQRKPLVEEVEAGTWNVTVTFPGGSYPSQGPASFPFTPPVFDELEVP